MPSAIQASIVEFISVKIGTMAKKKGKSSKASVRRDDRETSALMGNPVWRAFAAKEPISKSAQTTIGLAARKSLYALSNGQGAHGHFKELFVTANVGAYLAEQGIGQEFMVDFHAALEVIVECYARAESGFGFSLTKEEAVIVGVLLDLHEQQIQLADRAQLALALVEGYRRVTKAALYEFQVDLSKQASDAQ